MTSWTSLHQAGTDFMAAVRERPEGVLLAFDFDGTLAPIVPDPEDSRLHERSATALGLLAGRVATLAIITGRNVATVRRLARLDDRPDLVGLIVLGGYGAERWVVGSPDPGPETRPAAVEAALPRVRVEIQSCGVDGVTLEDKGRALGIHTRQSADPELAYSRLLPGLERIAAELGLTLEPGRSVIELRSSDVTKGDAIRALVAESGAAVAAFCGDDLGDLAAFDALVELRSTGIETCRVVSSSPEQESMDAHADILADGPDGIADWLTVLARG